MKVVVYQPDMEERLREFVQQADNATPAHMIEWRNILETAAGLSTHYLVAQENGSIVGMLPLALVRAPMGKGRLVSLPYLSHGGICAQGEAAEHALLSAARKMAVAYRAPVELRGPTGFSQLPTRRDKARLVLDISNGPEQVWRHLRSEIRNRIRKGRNSGLHTVVGGEELLPAFYSVFCHRMTSLGTPPHPLRFFQELLRNMPETRVIVVYNGMGTAAGAVLCFFRDCAEVPWVASRSEFLPICPNQVLYWEAIKFACQQGAKRFDFGRSTVGSGTFVFKQRWGAKPEPLAWQYVFPDNRAEPDGSPGPALVMASKIWRHLPVAAARALGPLVRRYLAE